MVEDSQPHPKVEKTPFLLLAWSMPPTATGSSVIARNLAMGLYPDETIMLGQVLYSGRINLDGMKQRRIDIPDYPIHWRIKPYVDWLYVIPLVVSRGCKAVRRNHLQAVVTIFPNAKYLVAGLLISLFTRVPFFPYFHNLYVETRTGLFGRTFARLIQRISFSMATRVLSMSEGMTDFLLDKYGIDSTPILHPIVLPIPQIKKVPDAEPPYRLAFSGNVNFTVAERIRHVIEAVGDDPLYEIILHTPIPPEQARHEIETWASNIIIKHIPDQEALIESLRTCDVMMLALADRHGKELEDDFRTQFPTRTLEMLISERPILVIAPKDYFITRFFEANDAGLTYTDNSIDGLRDAIYRMCTSTELRESCVHNALATADSYRVNLVAETLRRELRSERHAQM
jgi:hypothetical protein